MSRRVAPFFLLVFLLFFFSRTIAGWVIDYQWWQEIGQLNTWLRFWLYDPLPYVLAAILVFLVLFTVHARALKSVNTGLGKHREYAQISTIVLLVVSFLIAKATIQPRTVQLFLAGQGMAASSWKDPAFGMPLNFYLFDYPFYLALLNFLLALAFVCALVFAISKTIWSLPNFGMGLNQMGPIEISPRLFDSWAHSNFLRVTTAIFFLGQMVKSYLDRYSLLYDRHNFMTGIDYVGEHVKLPLLLMAIAGFFAVAVSCAFGKYKAILLVFIIWGVQALVPPIVNSLYVKPNEISLQKPYVAHHMEATRAAYALSGREKSIKYAASPEGNINLVKNKALLSTVRIWDWRAFHDTVTQLQPLRPYGFQDTDVDRYVLQGQMRQVLLTARELDMEQLGDARKNWPTTHLTYTHGYGVVAADANQITQGGLPNLFVHDAPPKITTPDLKLTQPEIYYGESSHEPVFVNTQLMEFNYPSGSENVHSKYVGAGGIAISGWPLRIAAAIYYNDYNILLTGYLTDGSRMLIHRKVHERVNEIAGFLTWDNDPYLVISKEGRLVWLIDGYTTADTHPYSQKIYSDKFGVINYIRNSVKATVDAYTGETKLYVFDPNDPIIQAYQKLFPGLLLQQTAMPPDLRAHARYPEDMFTVQSELFLTYHMLDADSFYNKADVWSTSRETRTTSEKAARVAPAYQIATLPGETEPEFMLTIPFTPRGKDNLIGMMVGRCDGDSLGELVFVELPKEELFYGPMQIEARLNQDQQISKDLTLWNQQGSQVVNGQMQVLPIDNTFLYIQPLYLQASQAKMPQLKKVVMAIGNRMVYADSYEQGLAEIAGTKVVPAQLAPPGAPPAAGQGTSAIAPVRTDQLENARSHMRRYRELVSQGKYAEAGKELEAIESALR